MLVVWAFAVLRWGRRVTTNNCFFFFFCVCIFCRQNAIRLEEKEKREKEVLHEILKEAEDYKAEYYSKWKLRCENNRAANREREKVMFYEVSDLI